MLRLWAQTVSVNTIEYTQHSNGTVIRGTSAWRYAFKLRYLHAKQLSPYEHNISIANGSSWRYHMTLGYHFEEQWYKISRLVLCFPIFITAIRKYTERCLLWFLGIGSHLYYHRNVYQVGPDYIGSHFEHSTSCYLVSWTAGNNLRKICLVTLGSILGLFYLRWSYLTVPNQIAACPITGAAHWCASTCGDANWW